MRSAGRLLVIDTSADVLSVALFDGCELVAGQHRELARGHAEALLPAVAALPGGGRAQAIWVGCGPGSFTGVRVGLAAARALGLAWSAKVQGIASVELIAAATPSAELIVTEAGHGEWFVTDVTGLKRATLALPPADAVTLTGTVVAGNRAEAFVARRGYGEAVPAHADARAALRVAQPVPLIDPQPLYGREPDARPPRVPVTFRPATLVDAPTLATLSAAAFDPAFGEGWTPSQLADLFVIPGIAVTLAVAGSTPCGFSAARTIAGESELLLLAVDPCHRRQGVGRGLTTGWLAAARACGATKAFLEVRADNPAATLYHALGARPIGRRPAYYRGADGLARDAVTMAVPLH